MPFQTNRLLESLPAGERQALAAQLAQTTVEQHQTLFNVRELISDIYFPIDAVVSLVVPLSTGEVIETAMVGRDGVIGAGATLNGRISLNQAIIQIGGKVLRCPVGSLRNILAEYPIQTLIGAREQSVFAQAQQSAACNATHVVESRLSRWLLRAADLHGSDELPLTNAGRPAYKRDSGRANFARSGDDPLYARPHQVA